MLQQLDVPPARAPLDVVVRVFPSAYGRDFDALRAEFQQALARLL